MEIIRTGVADVVAIRQEMHQAEQHFLPIVLDEFHADVTGTQRAVGAGQAHGHLNHAQVGPEIRPDAGSELGVGPESDLDRQPACHLVATVAGATLEGNDDSHKHAVAGAKHCDDAFG